MDPRYVIADTRDVITPALMIFHEILDANLAEMIRIAGSPTRLRPHCKTHKMREVIELELAAGIVRHKCATLAEAEMLARAGVKDILLAYNVVGANVPRVANFVQGFPTVRFAVTADHPRPVAELGKAMGAIGKRVEVLLDIDSGQHRTGLPLGDAAGKLYDRIAQTGGLIPGGFHLYDGQNHQKDIEERRAAVMAVYEPVARFRKELLASSLPVPRIVAGGSGSFPIFASLDDPAIELSPGTLIFHDSGYAENFPDLAFTPAALLLTRCISRPTKDRVTLDLGYKAVASDPPASNRLVFPDLPDAKAILQNEEHLVIETSLASRFEPGDELLAIPRHVCPTSALHKYAYVVRKGRVEATWQIAARDRVLTI